MAQIVEYFIGKPKALSQSSVLPPSQKMEKKKGKEKQDRRKVR
jgi:hypothetical protein